MPEHFDIAVVGAGLAGLVAATDLDTLVGGCLFSGRIAGRAAAGAV
jgi:predicted oxidoreductase